MNGPAHYREAEQALRAAYEKPMDTGEAGFYMAAAQAHATLALVAAAALDATNALPTSSPLVEQWDEVFAP